MGVDPTISGSSNLVMETGDKNLDGLISGVEKGILVTRALMVVTTTVRPGDFSYGIEGFPDCEWKTDATGIRDECYRQSDYLVELVGCNRKRPASELLLAYPFTGI